MVGLDRNKKETYLKLVQVSSLDEKNILVYADGEENFIIYERKPSMRHIEFTSLQSDMKMFPFHGLELQARGDIKVLEVYQFTNALGKRILRITAVRDTMEF